MRAIASVASSTAAAAGAMIEPITPAAIDAGVAPPWIGARRASTHVIRSGGSVEPERRAGVAQHERARQRRFGERQMEGDHPAHRQPDDMRRAGTEARDPRRGCTSEGLERPLRVGERWRRSRACPMRLLDTRPPTAIANCGSQAMRLPPSPWSRTTSSPPTGPASRHATGRSSWSRASCPPQSTGSAFVDDIAPA